MKPVGRLYKGNNLVSCSLCNPWHLYCPCLVGAVYVCAIWLPSSHHTRAYKLWEPKQGKTKSRSLFIILKFIPGLECHLQQYFGTQTKEYFWMHGIVCKIICYFCLNFILSETNIYIIYFQKSLFSIRFVWNLVKFFCKILGRFYSYFYHF